MSRQTELIARRISAGLCRDCGRGDARTLGGMGRCAECAVLEADRQRARRGTLEPGRRGRKRTAYFEKSGS